jgi:hypothetical protein
MRQAVVGGWLPALLQAAGAGLPQPLLQTQPALITWLWL